MTSPLEFTRLGSSGLGRLATARLLNGGPETCKRVERDVVDAIKKADWRRARELLHLRVRMRLAPTKDERATIDRILTLIDEAEANDVGPVVAQSPTRA